MIVGIILTVLVTISVTLIIVEVSVVGGAVLLALVVSYLIFSYTIVNVGEVAMMTIWGKPIKNLLPSWYFAPAGIVSIRKEKGTVFQDELPADPEKIFREEGKVPDGMFPPIRVKFGQPKKPKDPKYDSTLKDDPYNVAMVAEVVPVISWHITDATTFFRVMGDITNCRKIMADKATEVFSDDFATMTPAEATKNLGATSAKLEERLKVETTTWGVEISDAYVKPIIFSHPLNTAVVAVKIADQTAKAVVLTAEGERQKRAKEAAGTAEGIERLATAEKNRLVKTGLAKTNASGDITELLPDANTRVRAEAVKALAEVKGTLVLGETNTMLGINKTEGGDK